MKNVIYLIGNEVDSSIISAVSLAEATQVAFRLYLEMSEQSYGLDTDDIANAFDELVTSGYITNYVFINKAYIDGVNPQIVEEILEVDSDEDSNEDYENEDDGYFDPYDDDDEDDEIDPFIVETETFNPADEIEDDADYLDLD
jgi:hypothetical protein